MDYLGALRMFVRAVEVGSFSKAAIATNTKTSTISRAIASLEADLGVGLFHRTTRRAHLTEPGAAFYEQARSILRSLDEARDAASAMEGRPQGLIRLHVPSAFARLHVMPFVPDFLQSYPDIRLDVSLTDVRVDLLAVGADLAIRIGALIDSSLIARKLAPHRRVACASPAYLGRRPAITEPADLLRHNCLIYTLQPTDHWFFRHDAAVEDILRGNTGGRYVARRRLRTAARCGGCRSGCCAAADMAGRRRYQGGPSAARASRMVLDDRHETERDIRGVSAASHGTSEGAGLSGLRAEAVWQAAVLGSRLDR